MDIIKQLESELNLTNKQVVNTVNLLDQGASIPFIARYRKELTDSLEDSKIRELDNRLTYLRKLEDRKKTVIDTISKLGKLTPELSTQIDCCLTLTELEDIYRPYKPKKQTRGQIAIKKGLLGLANYLKNDFSGNLETEAKKYIDPDKGVSDLKMAIQGAFDIIAEEISDKEKYRTYLKNLIKKQGNLQVSLSKKKTTDLYDNYENFSKLIKYVKPHQILAYPP